MESLSWQTKFFSVLCVCSSLLLLGNANRTVKRQVNLGSPDDLLPESISGIPVPIVLPSGVVPDAGAVPAAGAIAPAPVIAPAPAILPANAIMEKNRATPTEEEKAKRFELPFTSDPMPQQWNEGLSQGPLFGQTQLPDDESAFSVGPDPVTSDVSSFTGQNKFMSASPEQLNVPSEMLGEATNRNEFGSNSLSFPQGDYNSPIPHSTDKVEYFEPNETGSPETPPYLDSTFADTGPSKEDLKKIEPLLESENFLTNSIIKDTWKQDSALTSSRQAVSESLTTAHQLANADWKNKPIIHEKTQQEANSDNIKNNTNFLLDEAHPGGMLKQEPMSSPVSQEKRPSKGNNEHVDDSKDKSNSLLQETQPVSMHNHESPVRPIKKERNNASTFLMTAQGTNSPKAVTSFTNSTRMYNHNPAGLSSSGPSVVLQKELIKKNLSEPHSDSHDDWFTNVTLAKSENSSLESSTADSLRNGLLSRKLYTAADYLKTLYPQLSLFKAPLKNVKDNTSLSSRTLSSLLHDNATLRKLISFAPNIETKDVAGKAKTIGLGPSKVTSDLQRKAQQELLKSLMKADLLLGERSVIKQNRKAPGNTRRSKKISKKDSTEGYLKESGAKLLPAHIFSPLGSQFKDLSEHSSTLAPKASITTIPTPANVSQPPTSSPLIVPTQEGQIAPVTQSHIRKEPTPVPVIVPTQSGMIVTAQSSSNKKQAENMMSATWRDSKVSFTSEVFMPPTMSTKTRYLSVQSGSISEQTSLVKNTSPTEAPLLPTQIGFIPSRKEKDIIWSGPAESNSGMNNIETNTKKQRLYSYESTRPTKVEPNPVFSRFQRKPIQWNSFIRNFGRNAVNSRMGVSWPVHSRKRRQLLVPVPLMQNNNNPQQLAGQTLLAGQIDGQALLPNMPELPQLQQPVQQFLPTQPLQGFLPQLVQSPLAMSPISLLEQPGTRSQFPLQQAMNQIPQTLFSPQQNQGLGLSLGPSPGQLDQLSKSIGVTPLQHVLPDQNIQRMLGYRQNDVRSIGPASLAPITVNVPMTAPRKIPSFLTASQVYKDFEDVNSRSHLSDDLFGGQMSRGDLPRNDFGLDDGLPDEPKYDKFAYENDKKMWGIDNISEDDDEANMFRAGPRKYRKLHYTSDDLDDDFTVQPEDLDETHSFSNSRYSTTGGRFHRPRVHHRHHWVNNENDLTTVNGKGIIGHNEGENEEKNQDGFHVADDTTENASKEDTYETPHKDKQPSKTHRPSLDDDNIETEQSEQSSSNDVREGYQSKESARTSQSESRESDETETESESQSDLPEDSSQGTQSARTSSEDKSDKNEELKDGLEESMNEESPTVISLPKPVSGPSSATLREEIVQKLSNGAVMHLNFDSMSSKPGENIVQDESGNKNDAGLANGAEISNRTMGSCGRVAILKHGEVMYKADHFSRKPTKAASIAMWVKSRKPGLVRWFDVGDNQAGSLETGPRAKQSGGKLVKVPKNQWIHLAGTFDSKDGIARVYVNGKLISETVGKKNQGLPDDFTATGIGEKFGDKFISFLDDVYMFDRVISAAEVKVLYRKCEFNRMVLHFGFQKVNTTTRQVMDQSGLDNNATFDSGAHIMNSGCDKCGACLDASNDNMPGVYLDGRKFHHKPASAISIASWISLNRTKGRHSIFQAVSNKNDEWHDIYNLDVINGKLFWRHKNEKSDVIFNVKTDDVVIPEGLWSHVTATYSSETGDAKIYVNGLLKASVNNGHKPKLNIAWGRVSIGGHLPDTKNFAGLLDEFFIYNWALDPSEVQFVLKYCADKPKLVSFTVRVPLFKRQKVQKAPQALNNL